MSPNPLSIYANTSFTIRVSATTNTGTAPSITSIQLPEGITTTAILPVTISGSGASIELHVAPGIAEGSYTIILNGQAGPATASTKVSAMLQASAPQFYFDNLGRQEYVVPAGGSQQVLFQSRCDKVAHYDIKLSLGGLPTGTTGTISPQTIMPGQSATVTITASDSAPPLQNVTVSFEATPSAPVNPATVTFRVDVTAKAGSGNRTDYVSTEATPYAAVYDPLHQLIFASNDTWNRVDVISSTSHRIVARIPIREPRGIDITQDNATVWVASGSRQVFAIDTTTLAMTRYLLPVGTAYWEGTQLLVLADSSMMIVLTAGKYTGTWGIAIWDPVSKAIEYPSPPIPVNETGLFRSGDGRRVYFIGYQSFYYDVATKSFSDAATVNLYGSVAVNFDGSRLAVCDVNGPAMYDGNFNYVGPLVACGGGGPPFFWGGPVFSGDGRYLYQEVLASIPVIVKIDASSLDILTVAPAMPMIPVMTELSPPYHVPDPFAVDDTGIVIGLQYSGIAFDDAAFVQHYSGDEPGTPTFMQHMDPYFGPLSGGTTSGGFGNAFPIAPSVWYGGKRGAAHLNGEILTITSPAATVPGPVNITMLFPDGIEVFDPLFFSYGPYLQYPLTSGAGPQGNVAAQIVGYGMPGDNITGTLKIGGSAARLDPPGSEGLPYARTPFPNKILSYTVPPGVPGLADITLTTPQGTSTLPKAFLYAQSVTDYGSTDAFTAVLYDEARQQVYLSAGDHIAVFSIATHQFVTPLNPPAQGNSKQFAGLTLTMQGMLLAADLLDGSLAVIDPDEPAASFAIPIAPPHGDPSCIKGPMFVAALVNHQAFVIEGGMPGSGNCGPGGLLYQVDLTARTAQRIDSGPTCGAAYLGSTRDGTKAAIGGGGICVYDAISRTYSGPAGIYQAWGGGISGDGSVVVSELILLDGEANVVGRLARPDLYYADHGGMHAFLFNPPLNDAGSLHYMPYRNFFDIVDVQHANLRTRFALSETITDTVVPMAIDSGGRLVFLITNKGLTVVDLGEAPLSIGWLYPAAASPGSQVTVRGSGFNSSTSATVGGQAAVVNVLDENTIVLTIPSIASGPAKIVVINSGGASYSSEGLLTIP